MRKSNTARFTLTILVIATLIVAIAGVWLIYGSFTVHNIDIAAGSARSESYVLMQALKTVVERHFTTIKVSVHETEGTTENLKRLEQGTVQFAVAQADVTAGDYSRIVAILFEDTFQLLVHKDSNVKRFEDLKGKKIGLPQGGGQFKSFLYLAGHFGLRPGDFTLVGANDDAGDMAFARNEADAVFRVRSLHNSAIERLTSDGRAAFVPIGEAQAMRIEQPAYNPAIIPSGTYLGSEPVPETDIPTVSVDRTFLARSDVDDAVVSAFLNVLMERRKDMADAIPATEEAVRPLVTRSHRPLAGGFLPSVHPGASAYYNRDSLTFIEKNRDAVILVAAAIVLMWAWIVALNHRAKERKNRHAEQYKERVAKLMEEAHSATSHKQLEPIRAELLAMELAAVQERHSFSPESFDSFHTLWQIAFAFVNHQSASTVTRLAAEPVPQSVQSEPDSGEKKKAWWSFGK
jgi:hypothetical protein